MGSGGALAKPSVLSHLFAIPWTIAHQAPLSMGFSRQEYWSGLPFPPPGDLPNPGIELTSPVSPALQMNSLPLSHLRSPCKTILFIIFKKHFSMKTSDSYWVLLAGYLVLTNYSMCFSTFPSFSCSYSGAMHLV